ncbi:hypothetical protein [Shewanella psychrophila]|uniref:hypothetical protein n=1 Tax=Shewanella psychrophila TaxID=225848 RepID=UPI0014726C3D|nr:hypothetical protein [Shewanella psychrophila]
MVVIGIASAPVVMIIVGGAAVAGGILGSGATKGVVGYLYELSPLEDLLAEVEVKVDSVVQEGLEQYILDSRFGDFSINNVF